MICGFTLAITRAGKGQTIIEYKALCILMGYILTFYCFEILKPSYRNSSWKQHAGRMSGAKAEISRRMIS